MGKSTELYVFEGIDGCGKTTQAQLFEEYLVRQGIPCARFREPGGTALGEEIRTLFLNGPDRCRLAQMFLFLACRAALLREKIEPALQEGKTVVLDRFTWSTIAYQGCADRLGVGYVSSLIDGLNAPSFKTFYLHCGYPVAQARLNASKQAVSGYDSAGPDYFQRVLHGYFQLAKKHRETTTIINAELNSDDVHREVVHHYNRIKSK